uniref:Reverse transcriptase domain-containing protein n=1 Tax=Tanacetum cinerariifolium TaxID=118510 RepID=A0A6L2L995_TANCI|nr:reverse transcriptase domain-containing protein [Tanacetum cinerariifolium]
MTRVLRSIAEHWLNIREGCPQVRQKKKGQVSDRNKAIQEDVTKFIEAQIMREVHYHNWLLNQVMVKKHDNNWRMWRRTKKKQFSTQVRECTATQIKNVGAPYQRLVDKDFKKQIGINLEVYVDDLVIKSHMEQEILRDIKETFKTLRKINMKIIPRNFIAERPDEDAPLAWIPIEEEILEPQTLFTDGSSCLEWSGVRLILINPEGMEFTYALRLNFVASNNEAEYEALVAGLRIA